MDPFFWKISGIALIAIVLALGITFAIHAIKAKINKDQEKKDESN
jgi:hypothetical protein